MTKFLVTGTVDGKMFIWKTEANEAIDVVEQLKIKFCKSCYCAKGIIRLTTENAILTITPVKLNEPEQLKLF